MEFILTLGVPGSQWLASRFWGVSEFKNKTIEGTEKACNIHLKNQGNQTIGGINFYVSVRKAGNKRLPE